MMSGSSATASPGPGTEAELIHWNGTTWVVHHGPSPDQVLPCAGSTLGPVNAWSAGGIGQSESTTAYREHWNGHVWVRR